MIFDDGKFADTMMGSALEWQKKNSFTYTSPTPDNNPYTKKFSTLSLYVMGLLPGKSVKPVQIINTRTDNCLADSVTNPDLTLSVTGSTTQVTLADLIKSYGSRNPDYSNTQKKFTIQIALLVHNNSSLTQSDADNFSKYLDAVEKYIPFAFSNKAKFTLLSGTSFKSLSPAIPSKPKVTTGSTCGGQITVSWTSSLNADSYNIYRATTATGSYKQIAKGLDASTTTYLDSSGLLITKKITSTVGGKKVTTFTTTPGTFYYKISATNSASTSVQSPSASATASGVCKTSFLNFLLGSAWTAVSSWFK